MTTRSQRFSLAARMTETWLERVDTRKPLTPKERTALKNYLRLLRELIKEIV